MEFESEVAKIIPQPIIKNSPPIGVMGPINVVGIASKSLMANRYNDPEKNNMPIKKHRLAYNNALLLKVGYSISAKSEANT